MTDKAVSTEDMCINLPRNASLDAARLEAVIKTVLENKVHALKNSKRNSSSTTSSPKNLFNKLRGASTSTASSRDRDEISSTLSPRSRRRCDSVPKKEIARELIHTGQRSQSVSTPRNAHRGSRRNWFSEHGNENLDLLCKDKHCSSIDCSDGSYSEPKNNGEVHIQVDEDLVSVHIENCDNLEQEELEERQKKAQRKKRRRRKHRQSLKKIATIVQPERFKDVDRDELSDKARITIACTAFVLIAMCLLLVALTLRMAPMIDELVRKENEEMLNPHSQDSTNSLQNLTTSVPSVNLE